MTHGNDRVSAMSLILELWEKERKEAHRRGEIFHIEKEICMRYGIKKLSDNEDAELEYMIAVSELEEVESSRFGKLILGGTSDNVNNHKDLKNLFYEKPKGYISFPNHW